MKIRVAFVYYGNTTNDILNKINFGWVGEELDKDIFQVDTIDCSKCNMDSMVRNYNFIIYYRVPQTTEKYGIMEAKRLGITVLYMIDDLMIGDTDPALHPFRPLFRSLMEHADYMIYSSPLLENLYIEAGLNKRSYIKIYGLPISRVKPIYRINEKTEFRIGWLGHIWHTRYEYLYEEVLERLSKEGVNLSFICFERTEKFIEKVSALPNIKLTNMPYIPFDNEKSYYQALADLNMDVVLNILPDDKLCRGKTQLKYLETALCRVPLISSDIGIWKSVINEGVNGMLAHTAEEFAEKVIFLKNHPKESVTMGENAFSDVVANYDVKKKADEFGRFLYNLYTGKTIKAPS